MAGYPGVEEKTVSATGDIIPPGDASTAVTGYSCVQLVGAFSGTILCEGSFDNGATWIALALVNMTSAATVAGGTGVTAAGIFRADVGAVARYRWRCSAYTSGTPKFYETARTG
jgi:hypothetical protein